MCFHSEIISEVHFHLRTNQIMQNFQRKSSEEMEEPPTTPTPLANLPEHLLPLNFHNTEALPDVNESQVFRPSIISENKVFKKNGMKKFEKKLEKNLRKNLTFLCD